MAPHQPISRSILTAGAEDLQHNAIGHWEYKAGTFGLPTRAVQTTPRYDLVTSTIALDGEFQLAKVESSGKHISRIGRISIVNYDGKVILDAFVNYPEVEGVTKKLPPRRLGLGVYRNDIHLQMVEVIVRDIVKDCVTVGHAIKNDFKVFGPRVFDGVLKRDTQFLPEYRRYATGSWRLPKLSVLAKEVLGMGIQRGDHSSVEDAQATMLLYRHREAEFEALQGGDVHHASSDAVDRGLVEWDAAVDFYNPEELEEQEEEPELLHMVLPPINEAEVSKSVQINAAFWNAKSGTLKDALTAGRTPLPPKQASKSPVLGPKTQALSSQASFGSAIKRSDSSTTMSSGVQTGSSTSLPGMRSPFTSRATTPEAATQTQPRSIPGPYISRSEARMLANVMIAYPLQAAYPRPPRQTSPPLHAGVSADIKDSSSSTPTAMPKQPILSSLALWSSFVAKG